MVTPWLWKPPFSVIATIWLYDLPWYHIWIHIYNIRCKRSLGWQPWLQDGAEGKTKKIPCDIKRGAHYRTCEILMDFEMPQKHYRNTATAQKMTNLVEHLYIIVASCCVKNAVLWILSAEKLWNEARLTTFSLTQILHMASTNESARLLHAANPLCNARICFVAISCRSAVLAIEPCKTSSKT